MSRAGFLRFITATPFFCLLISPAGAEAYEQELKRLSGEMERKIATARKTRLAVVDFHDLEGNVTALGRFLAEEFSTDLADTGQGFRVVDRTHLASILREHKLSETGLINPATARQLGKITGVEALITGSLTPFGDSIRIAIKILDTESATVIGSAKGNIAKTETIAELLGRDINRPSGDRPPPPPAGPSEQTVEVGGFRFDLHGCRDVNGKITCDLTITNLETDQELEVRHRSRMFDEHGNEHPVHVVKLANKSRDLSQYTGLSHHFIASVPTKAQISYSQGAGEVKLLTVMEIHSYAGMVQFRNVPVSR